jgi:hypothetical protein
MACDERQFFRLISFSPDLISQGFSGDELLAKFKEARRNVRPAVESLMSEAQKVAEGGGEFYTIRDLTKAGE